MAFVVLTLGYLAIGYSRFILGVHSANQILYGFIIGLWSVLFCIFTLDPIIEGMVENLKKKTMAKSKVFVYVGVSVVSSLVALASMIAAFEYVEGKDGFSLTPTYRKNIERCSGKPPSKKDVQNGNIKSGGVVLLGCAAILGTIFRYFYLNTSSRKVMNPSIWSSQFWITLVIKVVLMIPGILVAGIATAYKDNLDAIPLMLIQAGIPVSYIVFIMYSGLGEYLYNKFLGSNDDADNKDVQITTSINYHEAD